MNGDGVEFIKASFPLKVNNKSFNIIVKFAKYRAPQKQRLFVTVDKKAEKKASIEGDYDCLI